MIRNVVITVNEDHIVIKDEKSDYINKQSSFLILDKMHQVISYGAFASENTFKKDVFDSYMKTSEEDIADIIKNTGITVDQFMEKKRQINEDLDNDTDLFWTLERNDYRFVKASSKEEFNSDLLCQLINFELKKYHREVKVKFMMKYNYDVRVTAHKELNPLINDDFKKKVIKKLPKVKTVKINGDLVSWSGR